MSLSELLSKAWNWLRNGGRQTPSPSPRPAPGPVPTPAPAAGMRACMFYPLTPAFSKYGSGQTCSLLSFAGSHGNADEDAYRKDGLQHVKDLGGNTIVYIADRWLYGQDEAKAVLRMCICNAPSPVDGHHIPAPENWWENGRAYGITAHICVLFNDDLGVAVANREAHIKEMARSYSWATKDQCVLLVGLECNDTMDAKEAVRCAKLCRQYAPDKRVVIGSANATYLKQVAALDSSVELWLEVSGAGSPLRITRAAADAYLGSLKDLKQLPNPVWAGEYWCEGDLSIVKYVTDEATKLGCFVGSGKWN